MRSTASSAWAVVVDPYQAAGWKYKQVIQSDPVQTTFMNVGFEDSAWPTGPAAFGGDVFPPFTNPAQPNGKLASSLRLMRPWLSRRTPGSARSLE